MIKDKTGWIPVSRTGMTEKKGTGMTGKKRHSDDTIFCTFAFNVRTIMCQAVESTTQDVNYNKKWKI